MRKALATAPAPGRTHGPDGTRGVDRSGRPPGPASEPQWRPGRTPPPRASRAPVLIGQVFGSLGSAAAGASGALLITAQTGSGRLAAAPLGAVVLGGALSAWPLARLRSRGRRAGSYAVAFSIAGLGACLVLAGAAAGSIATILGGHVLMGMGNTAVMLSRYLIADLAPGAARAKAIGTSFLAVSLGAVSGPALLGPAAVLAAPLGLPDPAGLYLVSLTAMLLAAAVFTRTSRRLGTGPTERRSDPHTRAARGRPGPGRFPEGSLGAVLAMGAANLTMVSFMAVLPLTLGRHGHSLSQVGWAVSAHVAAMFVGSSIFGPVTGRLGPRAVATAGDATLAGTAVAAFMLPIESMTTGMLLLVSLGLGWGAVIVANSTRLATVVDQECRGPLEAASEIAMGVGALVGCFALAGPLVDVGGVPLLAVAIIPLHVAQLVPRRYYPRGGTSGNDIRR